MARDIIGINLVCFKGARPYFSKRQTLASPVGRVSVVKRDQDQEHRTESSA